MYIVILLFEHSLIKGQPHISVLAQILQRFHCPLNIAHSVGCKRNNDFPFDITTPYKFSNKIRNVLRPAIIDQETFDKAAEVRELRAKKLGRLNRKKKLHTLTVPTRFFINPAAQHYENPKEQAEYIYSLIESEVL